MAAVYLTASFPDAFTKEGLILGNPQSAAAIDSGSIPSGSWSAVPELAITPGAAKKRLMTIISSLEVEVLQVSENETTATAKGVATRFPVPSSGFTSYAMFLHPGTVGVYVRTP